MSYKVLIRVREKETNKLIHQRKIFEDYDEAMKYIDKNLAENRIIKLKFFENDKAFGYGEIFYCNGYCNYIETRQFLKKLFD